MEPSFPSGHLHPHPLHLHHHHHHHHHHHVPLCQSHRHHLHQFCPQQSHHHHHHHFFCLHVHTPAQLQEAQPAFQGSLNIVNNKEASDSQVLEEAENEGLEEEDDEDPVFVLTDEWRDFFATSEARRTLEKQQAKRKGKK